MISNTPGKPFVLFSNGKDPLSPNIHATRFFSSDPVEHVLIHLYMHPPGTTEPTSNHVVCQSAQHFHPLRQLPYLPAQP